MSSKFLLAVGSGLGAALGLLWFFYRRRWIANQQRDALASQRQSWKSGEGDAGAFTRLEVRIPTAAVGSVIGRSGNSVRDIEARTGARIRFRQEEDSSDDSCTVALIWGKRRCVVKAKAAVERVIASKLGDGAKRETYKMSVPLFAYGYVIGRQGQTIRDISRQSDAQIDLNRNVGGRMGTCTIVGTADQIARAKAAIEEKVEEADRRRTGPGDDLTRQELNDRVLDFIPRLPDAGSDLLVCVSASEHPSHFWVQVIDKQAAALERLNREINSFYSVLGPEDMALAEFLPGTVCCAKCDFDSRWYRARVESVQHDGKVDLYFVDYGDNGTAIKEDVRNLKSRFLRLRFQAVPCCLANLTPKDGSGWSEEACDTFEELTHCAQWNPLQAKILQHQNDTGYAVIEIMDPCETEAIHIAKKMAEKGFGVYEE